MFKNLRYIWLQKLIFSGLPVLAAWLFYFYLLKFHPAYKSQWTFLWQLQLVFWVACAIAYSITPIYADEYMAIDHGVSFFTPVVIFWSFWAACSLLIAIALISNPAPGHPYHIPPEEFTQQLCIFASINGAARMFFKKIPVEEPQPQRVAVGQPAAQQQITPPPGVNYYRLPQDPYAYNRVIGVEEPKQRMLEAVKMLLNDEEGERMQRYGLKPPKGILLYGPPGTGKTSFARATAQLFGIPFLVINASSILGTYLGVTEHNIRQAFAFARYVAPCVMFFDEIDAIGKKRTGGDINSPSQVCLNCLLSELDGFHPLNKVIVIGATNRIDILDDALIRPGRLDLHIEVGLPELKDRARILKLYLGNRPQEITDEDLYNIAQQLDKYSPAKIEALVNEAARLAYKENAKISVRHFYQQVASKRLSITPD